jgi:hypothetical protein
LITTDLDGDKVDDYLITLGYGQKRQSIPMDDGGIYFLHCCNSVTRGCIVLNTATCDAWRRPN